MSENMFGNDLCFESGVEVKQEQMLDCNSVTGSLPIPTRRATELSELRDCNLELEFCNQDIFQTSFFLYNYEGDSNSKNETFNMDDDDIFQVDKADLIQGPTLAELNANDETLLGDLNFDGLELPEDSSFYLQLGGSQSADRESTPTLRVHPPCVGYREGGAFSPCSSVDTGSQQGSPGLGLHELLSPPHYTAPPILPNSLQKTFAQTRLSSSAPTHLTSEQLWARREPRKHLLSTGSLAEAGSTSSISTGGVLSPRTNDDLSQDEESDDDSDKYEDFSSDGEDDDDLDSKPLKARQLSKQEKFFWQYNLQAKGPKGQRLVLKARLEDPHVLNEVTDPVFSPNCSVRGIKHSGKARKGDGNDLTPNPKKLHAIGKELDGLSRIINDMTPVSELPFNVRPKTRKEKNKLASRACRLKKKAQHEANKLKLYGLEHEHKRLLKGIAHIKNVIATIVTAPNQQDSEANMEKILKSATKVKIAGHTSEFVNRVLEKVKAGVPGGGLNEF